MTSYDSHGIFMWNDNNILYSNVNNTYNNVILHTGSVIKGQWENSICVTNDNNTTKVISNSNHFLHGFKWGAQYNNLYKIKSPVK